MSGGPGWFMMQYSYSRNQDNSRPQTRTTSAPAKLDEFVIPPYRNKVKSEGKHDEHSITEAQTLRNAGRLQNGRTQNGSRFWRLRSLHAIPLFFVTLFSIALFCQWTYDLVMLSRKYDEMERTQARQTATSERMGQSWRRISRGFTVLQHDLDNLKYATNALEHTWQKIEPILHDLQRQNPFNSLRGPHITTNFPDPSIVAYNNTAYAFATNNRKTGSDHIRVQVATANKNQPWTLQPQLDALPHVAPWQTGNAVWAPDVKHLPDGRFILYYTDSLKTQPETHCIGAASSTSITGPYVPQDTPLLCPHGGAIDPAGFFDRSTGKRYILYKIDGNSLGHGGSCRNDKVPIVPTPIMLQEVNQYDGTTFIGDPVQIHDRDALDGPLIEAPTMYLSAEGVYFLFYSSDCFTTPLYHTTYATAMNITGPYTRAYRPLLTTGDGAGFGLVGPGGLDIIHRDYATSDITSSSKEHDTEKDGHLVVFHGQQTVHNSPSDHNLQRPIHDLHQPFVRGMYSGTAYFRGRSVSLGSSGLAEAHLRRADYL